MMFGFKKSKSILTSRIDFEKSEIFFLLFVRIILEELSNINYFISKSIIIESILKKSVLSKINSTKSKNKHTINRLNLVHSSAEKCVFCDDDNESVEHMFTSCKTVW